MARKSAGPATARDHRPGEEEITSSAHVTGAIALNVIQAVEQEVVTSPVHRRVARRTVMRHVAKQDPSASPALHEAARLGTSLESWRDRNSVRTCWGRV